MRPRVVIVGAGFGGLTCARALKRAAVELLVQAHLMTGSAYKLGCYQPGVDPRRPLSAS